MASDLHIDFRLNGQSYEVDFYEDSISEASIFIGGRYYHLKGSNEATDAIKECLALLPRDSTHTLEQAGKELKARLWQLGAKEIKVCTIASRIFHMDDLSEIVDKICTTLEAHYVFPEVAKKCSEFLRRKLEEGVYEGISDLETLAQAITSDLRQVSEDKHMAIFRPSSDGSSRTSFTSAEINGPYSLPELAGMYTYKPETTPLWWPYEMRSGFLVDHPDIGYIDLRGFESCSQDESVEKDMSEEIQDRKNAFIQAVENLKTAKSIMIDLRNNGGGDPAAVQFLCSLFMDENLPLNHLEWRIGDQIKTTVFSTLSHEEISKELRLLEMPLFILIGPRTFSAAEEFSNNMKVLGRAKLVGEPSRGGANPGDFYPIGEGFIFFVPTGRTVNPLEGGNWEGRGVIPDHMVPAADALDQTIHLAEST